MTAPAIPSKLGGADRLRARTPKKKWKVVAITIALGALTAGTTLALSRARHSAPVVDRGTVWSESVKRGAMLREVQGIGALVPEEVRWLTATTPARVAEVRARSGATVRADTVVVVLENPDLTLQSLEAARLEASAEADLVKLGAALRNAHLAQEASVVGLKADAMDSARRADADDALARRGYLSNLELAQSKGRAESLDGRVRLESKRIVALEQESRAQIVTQQSQIERLKSIAAFRQRQLDDLAVRAGVDGMLEDVPVQVGQWVTPGTLLGKVGQPDRLKAELRVPESQAKDVQVGQRVSVDTHNGIVAGKVARMDGAVQNGTVKVDVTFEQKLPAGARPDLSVEGTIEIERLDDVMYIARPAIVAPQGTVATLFKVNGTEAVRVQVRFGRSSAKTVEVTAGLIPGDEVILSDTSPWASVDRIRLQ